MSRKTKRSRRDLLLWTEDVEAAEEAVCNVLAKEGFGTWVWRSADGFSATNYLRLVPAPVDRDSDPRPEDLIEVQNERAMHFLCRRSLNPGDERLLLSIRLEHGEDPEESRWWNVFLAPIEFALARYDLWRRRRARRRIVASLRAKGVVIPR